MKATVAAVDGDDKAEVAQAGGSLLGKLANLKGMVAKKQAKSAA